MLVVSDSDRQYSQPLEEVPQRGVLPSRSGNTNRFAESHTSSTARAPSRPESLASLATV